MAFKVCHLTSVHGPFDTRIFHKMCKTLAKEGFVVSLVVANANSLKVDGVQIDGVPVAYDSRFQRILKAPKAIYKKALEIDADIYHLHDPELLGCGVKLQKLGKKVIFDSHEDIPKDILDKTWLGPLFIRSLVSELYRHYENWRVSKLSGVISVLDSITQRFNHPNSITIHNYPILEEFEVERKVLDSDLENKFKLVYNGGLTKIRGIHKLIEAMGFLDNSYSLLLMGPWESDDYRETCENIEGWSRVNYLGTLEIKECYSVLKACQLGVLVFQPLPNHIQSLPNKSFEYVASELPVIMSDFSLWRQFFGKYAHFVDPQKPQEIADAVLKISENYLTEKERISKEGIHLLDKYTWVNEGKRLVEFYQNLLN